MSNWQEVQLMMQQARTPGEKQEALRALQEHVPQDILHTHMATLSKDSDANLIKLSELHLHADNDEVFERLKNLTATDIG
jgi:hypothetical protein